MKNKPLIQKRENTLKNFFLLIVLAINVPNLLVAQQYTIPTVVHIISSNQFPSMFTDVQIQSGLDNLNKQFSGQYANDNLNKIISQHQSFINDSGIQFKLATIDPNGQPTTGITRMFNNTWSTDAFNNQDAMKNLLSWDRSKYLNIYIYEQHDSGFRSGVGYLPWEVATLPKRDGVMVPFRIWPHQFPFANPQWTDGWEGILAHEVGHYLNLSHTWAHSNNPTTCATADDFVADTPKHAQTFEGLFSTVPQTGCDGVIAMTANFMTYSRFQTMFTPGQTSRMVAALNSSISSRNNLWTAQNLAATGVSGTPPDPTYCIAAGKQQTNITAIEWISNVQFSTINNSSTGDNKYQDFSSIVANVTTGDTYTLTVELNQIFNANNDHNYVVAWLDWNDNKTFEASELINLLPQPMTSTTATASVTVPGNAVLGNIRLRIRSIWEGNNILTTEDPCGNALWGEVEDYTVNVINLPCGIITSDSFETGFGNWNDGGVDAARKQINPNTGIRSVRIRDNSGISSSIFSDTLDLSSYTEILFSFSFFPYSMENGEDFLLEKSLDGGITYSNVQTWVSGTDFNNDIRYNESIPIFDTFTSNTVFRLRCDASGNKDHIYIDDIIITSCLEQNMNRNSNTTTIPSDDIKDIDEKHVMMKIKVYPNPTSEKLYIEFNETKYMDILLFNSSGQLIRKIVKEEGKKTTIMDVNNLSKGFYFIKIMDRKGEIFKAKTIIIN